MLFRDNISDGMMTRETDALSDAVMNALWFSHFYKPTSAQGEEELNAGKLARESVISQFYISVQTSLTLSSKFLGTLYRRRWARMPKSF